MQTNNNWGQTIPYWNTIENLHLDNNQLPTRFDFHGSSRYHNGEFRPYFRDFDDNASLFCCELENNRNKNGEWSSEMEPSWTFYELSLIRHWLAKYCGRYVDTLVPPNFRQDQYLLFFYISSAYAFNLERLLFFYHPLEKHAWNVGCTIFR